MKRCKLVLLLFACVVATSYAEDWQAAIRELEGKPRNATNNRLLAIAYNNHAIQLQSKSQWEQAEALLKKAITIDPKGNYHSNLAHVYLNHAAELYKKRSSRTHTGFMHREAKLNAQRALVCDQKLASAHILIGDIEYENQNLKAAREAWEHAKRIEPNARGIDARLRRLGRESKVETTFKKNRNAFFDIRYEHDIDSHTASGLRLALEAARKVIGQEFHYRPKHRLVLLVYSTNTFSQLKLGPHWAGGLYDGKIRLPLDNNANEEQLTFAVATLFHEYTHAIVHDLARGNCPVWLNEGLAETQEAKITASEQWRLKAAAASGGWIPLQSLDNAFSSSNTDTVLLAYQQANSLASYLLETKGYRRVKLLLEKLGRDVPFELALRDACNLSTVQLETEWRLWLSSRFVAEQ